MTLALLKTLAHGIEIGTQTVPLRFVRNTKARRYILRMLSNGVARVTIPRGGTVGFALEFARKNTTWLTRQLQQAAAHWDHGTEILFRGIPHPIGLTPKENGWAVSFAHLRFDLAEKQNLRAAIEARLRELAGPELIARTHEIARLHALEIRSVQVRNQRSRWGSCSMRKTISLNWRLIQAPEFVRDYIIVHELTHLYEMNHSAKFWTRVAAAFPAYRDAERWLRRHSRLLR